MPTQVIIGANPFQTQVSARGPFGIFRYRGLETKELYSFLSPLIDANGRPVVGGQYSVTIWNGETVVYCNNDGSLARGTAGPTPAGYPYGASTDPSPWERLVPPTPPEGGYFVAPLAMTLEN